MVLHCRRGPIDLCGELRGQPSFLVATLLIYFIALKFGTLPTSELIRQALDETKELVRLEVKLAREEVRDDVLQLKHVVIFGGIALLTSILALSTLVTAVVLVTVPLMALRAVTTAATVPGRNSGDRAGCRTARR